MHNEVDPLRFNLIVNEREHDDGQETETAVEFFRILAAQRSSVDFFGRNPSKDAAHSRLFGLGRAEIGQFAVVAVSFEFVHGSLYLTQTFELLFSSIG